MASLTRPAVWQFLQLFRQVCPSDTQSIILLGPLNTNKHNNLPEHQCLIKLLACQQQLDWSPILAPAEVIIIIIIAFKGSIRDFLQSPHSAANCLQHVRSSCPGAVVCKSRATHRALITCKCHVTCHLVRRGSSAINSDGVEIAFILALIYWLNH